MEPVYFYVEYIRSILFIEYISLAISSYKSPSNIPISTYRVPSYIGLHHETVFLASPYPSVFYLNNATIVGSGVAIYCHPFINLSSAMNLYYTVNYFSPLQFHNYIHTTGLHQLYSTKIVFSTSDAPLLWSPSWAFTASLPSIRFILNRVYLTVCHCCNQNYCIFLLYRALHFLHRVYPSD